MNLNPFSWFQPSSDSPHNEIDADQPDPSASSSPRIVLSVQAYADILNETSQHLQTETGGVLIGASLNGIAYAVESIDPGPRAVLTHSYFEYDQAYVRHLANKVSKKYASPLRLLGLWHRHPGSFDRFSSTDDQTHLLYIQQCRGPVVSILVNIDPKVRLTPYIVDGPPVRHHRVSHAVGDDLFPRTLLQTVDHATLLQRINTPHRALSTRSDVIEIGGGSQDPAASAQQRPKEIAAPVKPDTENVLAMLDSEMDFLESQRDFSYQLEMAPKGLLLTLRRLSGSASDTPLQFLFMSNEDKRAVLFEKQSYKFQEGIIEQLIGERFY